VLVQLVDDDGAVRLFLKADDDPHASAVRFVAQLRYSLDLLRVHQLRYAGDERRFVHLVRDLGDDDVLTPLLRLLYVKAPAYLDAAASRGVSLGDAVGAHDDTAGGEIGPLDVLHQLLHLHVRIVDQVDYRVHHL